MTETNTITQENQYELLRPVLNERQWRIYLGTEARKLGLGGISQVARVASVDRETVSRGIADSKAPPLLDRIRLPGGGRKTLTDTDPTLETDLEALLDPKGDPMSPIQWTTKSLSRLESTLNKAGHAVSYRTIGRILKAKGFSLQANKKNVEGVSHPDRDGQFQLINTTIKDFLATGDPVISVDCKKKELLGNFKNNGREWQPKGSAEVVNVYDFPSLADGKAVPYGIYDRLTNTGFVNVGTSADTSAFAVESIRRWWKEHGRKLYPNAKRLLITCDGGGSNGSRNRLWKKELQELVDEIGIPITIRHYPPATSKWNAIEHKLFSYISINWRAKPLTSLETIIRLISSTTTTSGLTVTAVADTNIYEKGIKISDKELAALNVRQEDFHGEWNYTIGVSA
ncbi:ISAzo13 family transposase [Candidatus Saccharibacteria bacterium]|nr:MAG: ISAzo13 family transposase [Candidatus Saccharibacteria bacterium]